MARVDTPAKVRGEATFGIDVVLPNMLTATVKRSPVFGGQLDGETLDYFPASADKQARVEPV